MATRTSLNFRVTIRIPSTKFINTWQVYNYTAMDCASKQAACRRAFKYWIASGFIKNQPKSNFDWPSTFENVHVEVL